jgi:CRP/FNR family transcriptional regulator, cyclic AMP receptor protein
MCTPSCDRFARLDARSTRYCTICRVSGWPLSWHSTWDGDHEEKSPCPTADQWIGPGQRRGLFSCEQVPRRAACDARGMKAGKAFDVQAFLESSGPAGTSAEYGRGETIFTPGDACKNVLYIQSGGVKLSVLSKTGREAVVAVLGPDEFFGEGCLAGQAVRTGTATAITPSVILRVAKARMIRLLHQQHGMSDRFISHMLSRNVRIEEDLIHQLFNSSERRLARALLLMARYGTGDKPTRVVPKISQETLAGMVGATLSKVKFLLAKFNRLGFIEYGGGMPLKINRSLLSVVLHD